MQFCADKRAEWKARSTRCPCPCPLSPSRIAAPVRSANDGFFVVARPLARSTLFRSKVRCSATRGRPCLRPTRSRAGTWRRSRRHSTVALLALPVFGETRALTIALRLALGCVYESPFSLSRVLAYPQPTQHKTSVCHIISHVYRDRLLRIRSQTPEHTHTHTQSESHADKHRSFSIQNISRMRNPKNGKSKEAHTSPGRR